jgi:acetate kinase
MGFTPLEGLVMATRSGSVDPGMLLWLQRHEGITAEELDDALEHRSGIAGLSGLSGDMRELLEAVDRGDERAKLAYDVYIHRLRGHIAAMVAAARGIDALVFTGGIGEHSERVRADACAELTPIAGATVLVVEAREDLELAAQAEALIAQ